jgi:hypothetical protein
MMAHEMTGNTANRRAAKAARRLSRLQRCDTPKRHKPDGQYLHFFHRSFLLMRALHA